MQCPRCKGVSKEECSCCKGKGEVRSCRRCAFEKATCGYPKIGCSCTRGYVPIMKKNDVGSFFTRQMALGIGGTGAMMPLAIGSLQQNFSEHISGVGAVFTTIVLTLGMCGYALKLYGDTHE